jgi:RNA recognition motif-containing protein
MSFTVFLGNLPVWVTADDIKSWLTSENLVADAVKVIRNPETQESKGFAFIESPNQEEMNSIIRRFDRAPLEDRLLRANPAQPPKAGGKPPVKSAPPATDRPKRTAPPSATPTQQPNVSTAANGPTATPVVRKSANPRRGNHSPSRQSAFAEELAKAL